MTRRSAGQVIERTRATDTFFGLRFHAYGKRPYVSLGKKSEGWTRAKAEDELQNVLADVRRGLWRPHAPEVVDQPVEVPTFREFASKWLTSRESELRDRTIKDYKWC